MLLVSAHSYNIITVLIGHHGMIQVKLLTKLLDGYRFFGNKKSNRNKEND